MADFRRPPEWQQDAHRHSTLIDPVLTVRPISRFDYTGRRSVSAIDHALVFVTAKGSYDVFVPPHRPSRADAASRRYTSVYEVDMGSHPVQLELALPSDDDAFSFGATADLTWRVSDPVAYVASGERDVPTRLTRELHQLARPVSRRFAVEDSPAAESAVQQAVEAGGFAAGIGLAVTCAVRLRLDDEAIAHRRRMRSLRYESEMLDPEHEFRLRQARQQHELEALRQRQAHALTAEKIHFYQYWLQHGGVAAWALHLAQHPEDTRLAVGALQQEQLTAIRSELELIAGDTLEDYQRAEAARSTLHAVDELIQQRTAPAADQGALPPGAGRPYVPPQTPDAPPGTAPPPAATLHSPSADDRHVPAPPPAPPYAAGSPYGAPQPPGPPYGVPPVPPATPVPHPPAPSHAAPGPAPAVPPAPGAGPLAAPGVPPAAPTRDDPEGRPA
ncbi:PE-PGRS family protein [Streptomyces sp. TRM S81-3]|uniref:PE-PGRS family protein n=1 Tax=Streptomyces griseicoloratus TaxID=2752516 RepID=A0A926L2M7_9ACTN|nr:PE-PGRS family protein [Streptomyces griseicoloratus]MBD0419157.1 PE-PGRS family protein [Streptomyces griseicoloratus]